MYGRVYACVATSAIVSAFVLVCQCNTHLRMLLCGSVPESPHTPTNQLSHQLRRRGSRLLVQYVVLDALNVFLYLNLITLSATSL